MQHSSIDLRFYISDQSLILEFIALCVTKSKTKPKTLHLLLEILKPKYPLLSFGRSCHDMPQFLLSTDIPFFIQFKKFP